MTSRITVLAVTTALFALTLGGAALADGTQTLGPPSIPISDGNGVVAAGTGLRTEPGSITVDVPAGAVVRQVLLYWGGQTFLDDLDGDASIEVGGVDVTGTRIGGPTPFFVHLGGQFVHAVNYRADITNLGLVGPGTTTLTVGGLSFSHLVDGAGVVVVYDTGGQAAAISLRDGTDTAFVNFEGTQATTEPQTFTFDASPSDRTATLQLFASSISPSGPRPNAVTIAVDGEVSEIVNPFDSIDGAEWDTYSTTVNIPAGATSVTVQAWSKSDGTSNLPASLVWSGAFFTLQSPPPPQGDGCTATPGYWKTHSEFGPAPYVDTWAELSNGASTALFGSGKTWYSAFHTPPRGSAYWILAHQYMAATLNELAGADASAVATDLSQAASLLDAYGDDLDGVDGAVRERFVSLAGLLDDYNNGNIGPGHCDG